MQTAPISLTRPASPGPSEALGTADTAAAATTDLRPLPAALASTFWPQPPLTTQPGIVAPAHVLPTAVPARQPVPPVQAPALPARGVPFTRADLQNPQLVAFVGQSLGRLHASAQSSEADFRDSCAVRTPRSLADKRLARIVANGRKEVDAQLVNALAYVDGLLANGSPALRSHVEGVPYFISPRSLSLTHDKDYTLDWGPRGGPPIPEGPYPWLLSLAQLDIAAELHDEGNNNRSSQLLHSYTEARFGRAPAADEVRGFEQMSMFLEVMYYLKLLDAAFDDGSRGLEGDRIPYGPWVVAANKLIPRMYQSARALGAAAGAPFVAG